MTRTSKKTHLAAVGLVLLLVTSAVACGSTNSSSTTTTAAASGSSSTSKIPASAFSDHTGITANSVAVGNVSVVGQPYYGQLFLQTDAAVNSGNSGGPLCAADGRVLGLVTFTMGDAQELGFAIPDPTLLGFLHQAGLLADRSVSPLAGIEGIPGYYDTSDVTYDDTYYSDAPTSFLDDPDAPAILLVVCAVEGVGIAGLLAALVVVLSRRRGRRTKRTA